MCQKDSIPERPERIKDERVVAFEIEQRKHLVALLSEILREDRLLPDEKKIAQDMYRFYSGESVEENKNGNE